MKDGQVFLRYLGQKVIFPINRQQKVAKSKMIYFKIMPLVLQPPLVHD
jgi:hypothetical protein